MQVLETIVNGGAQQIFGPDTTVTLHRQQYSGVLIKDLESLKEKRTVIFSGYLSLSVMTNRSNSFRGKGGGNETPSTVSLASLWYIIL